MNFGDLVIPLMVGFILFYGFFKRIPVFSCFVEGAKDGLSSAVSILPTLCALFLAVGMIRSSGVLEVLTDAVTPVCHALHFLPEVLPLALMRPISGSGALALLEDLFAQYGADSLIGKTASVLMGSTETTFYTIAVYYGAVQITNSRHTVVCALLADLAGFLLSGFFTRLLLT